ncbi:hypothetical protein J3P75_05045 [Pseudomonas sp. R1-1]|uniref:hypothetical protein n=1 Tax=Pseudomonas sp. R1-1 TaxID=1602529 RepID=UPI003DA99584
MKFSESPSTNGTVVLMREPEMTKSGAFFEFAKKYQPCRILDLRIFPRLDFFAGSRIRTFKLFEELHIEYLDFFGRAAINPNNSTNEATTAKIVEFLNLFLANQNENKGPTILFFDNDSLLQECKKRLPSCLPKTLPATKMNVAEYKSGFLSMCLR